MSEQHWTAEQTAHPQAKADRWSVVYNPTPGGRDNGDGTRSFSLRFPALLICDIVSEPENVAREVADLLNASEAALTRAEAHERELFDVARVAIEMQMDAPGGQHVNPQRAVDEVVAARAAMSGEPQP